MKKIIIMIILAGVVSCSKKNMFMETKNDMESIVTETSKLYEAIDKEQEELPEIDTSKIRELNNKFKEKYKEIKMEASTQYEQVLHLEEGLTDSLRCIRNVWKQKRIRNLQRF